MGAALGNEFIILQEIPLNLLSAALRTKITLGRKLTLNSDKFPLDPTIGLGNLHTFKCPFLFLCNENI